MSPALFCVACGHEGPGVRLVLTRWREPLPGRPFEVVSRCVDRTRCRETCVSLNEPWPFVDTGEEVPAALLRSQDTEARP